MTGCVLYRGVRYRGQGGLNFRRIFTGDRKAKLKKEMTFVAASANLRLFERLRWSALCEPGLSEIFGMIEPPRQASGSLRKAS